MANPLLAAVYENMAVVSDEYFNKARDSVPSPVIFRPRKSHSTFSFLEI